MHPVYSVQLNSRNWCFSQWILSMDLSFQCRSVLSPSVLIVFRFKQHTGKAQFETNQLIIADHTFCWVGFHSVMFQHWALPRTYAFFFFVSSFWIVFLRRLSFFQFILLLKALEHSWVLQWVLQLALTLGEEFSCCNFCFLFFETSTSNLCFLFFETSTSFTWRGLPNWPWL